MPNKKWIVVLMCLAAAAQIIIPAMMVINSEHVLTDGIANKIRTAPIDPNDPFRGKYIQLNFKNDFIDVKGDTEWKRNNLAYVLFQKDSLGFASIKSITKEPPLEYSNYIKTKILHVSYYSNTDVNRIYLDFPFDRFYMEESKAPKAEKLYMEQRVDSTAIVYALLMVEDGQFILKDVVYNGESISEAVE